MRDLGSRDFEFLAIVRDIRRRLLGLAAVSSPDYEAIPVQGSGTFALESVIGSVIPQAGKILIAVNGAYGRRLVQIASALKIAHVAIECEEDHPADPSEIERVLASDPSFTHAAVVHCETSTGIINRVRDIGEAVHRHGGSYIVDAMSSFGGIPLNMSECRIDYLISSANKCIQGVPGFAFVLARREALLSTAGFARSLSLDLWAQWKGLENSGQFRFTPPTHTLLAFHQALKELEEEGGVEIRAARYRANCEILLRGMRELGFEEYLRPEVQGYIITSFRYPGHPQFKFETFYERLNEKGYVIYPGKTSKADCFRIGNIGHIFPDDIRHLLIAVRQTLDEMGVELSAATRLAG